MARRAEERAVELRGAQHEAGEGPGEIVRLDTSVGPIRCRQHPAGGQDAILWVSGAGGGLGGPAGGVYARLAEELVLEGVTSLELDYRRPGYLEECVLDVLLGLAYLQHLGKRRVVLVGHSFGGAVVIAAGVLSDIVIGVVAMSSQTYGAGAVSQLSPRPILLVHGTADEILPDSGSRRLYEAAGEPKQLILYDGCRHGLDQCRDDVDRDLLTWLRDTFGRVPA